jgi:hypothetical protein
VRFDGSLALVVSRRHVLFRTSNINVQDELMRQGSVVVQFRGVCR